MKNYLIRIGQYTRRGNFQEMNMQAVSVADEVSKNQLHNYFSVKYKGFSIKVDDIETIDISGEIAIPSVKNQRDPQGSLSFKVIYNEGEKELFAQSVDLIKQYRMKIKELHDSIEFRYAKLSYTRIDHHNFIRLSTDDYGTFCDSLSIKSNDFFKVVKECVDGVETERLEITPRNTDNELNESDIPF